MYQPSALKLVPNGATPVKRPPHKQPKRTRKGERLYRTLDSRRNEFRLLTIHPRTVEASVLHQRRRVIPASLVTESLDSTPSYVAVSYVWNSACSYLLIVDSIRVEISRNLGLAIEEIRHDTKPIRIWVDAVCINQADLDEKAWQIGLMSRIYQQASQTLIWLGEGSAPERQAMEFFCTLTPKKFIHEMNTLEGLSQAEQAGTMNVLTTTPDNWELFNDSSKEHSPLAKWENLRRILSLPWWGRRWVIQEAFFSKNPTVVLGNVSSTVDKFAELATWHARYVSRNRSAHFVVRALFRHCPFYYLLRQWKAYRRDLFVHRAPLPVWLTLTRDFDQSIPRDLVFGLLSLASARDQLNIQPDYWGSDHMVFTRLFIHLIEIYGFRTFRFGLPSFESLGGLTLPSWCSGDKYGGFRDAVSSTNSALKDPELFKACGDTKQSIRFVYEYTGEEVTFTRPGSPKSTLSRDILLVAKGFQFDEVAIVLPTGLSSNGVEDIKFNSLEEQLRAAVQGWQRRLMGVQVDPYRHTCGRYEALLMTLLGGRLGNLTKADWLIQFREWIQPEQGFSLHGGKEDAAMTALAGHNSFYMTIRPRCFNRSLIITAKGYIGLGPLYVEEGDVVSIFHGIPVPLALRKQNKAKFHSFVGEMYVHGIMHGEATQADTRKVMEFSMT